ncbi:MAG: helix-turn-helix domain-containing protein, partial [Oscillospiraceae bacterium]
MTIGEKIKNARNLRGLTQKELGIKLGFDEKSADVRIAQYESGTRTPKSELLSEI